jgi:hypothetical protein
VPRKTDQLFGKPWHWSVFWEGFWGAFGLMMALTLGFGIVLALWSDELSWGRILTLSLPVSVLYGLDQGCGRVHRWRNHDLHTPLPPSE